VSGPGVIEGSATLAILATRSAGACVFGGEVAWIVEKSPAKYSVAPSLESARAFTLVTQASGTQFCGRGCQLLNLTGTAVRSLGSLMVNCQASSRAAGVKLEPPT
jgi:hypothetical protein